MSRLPVLAALLLIAGTAPALAFDCTRVAPGARSSLVPELALSAAHAELRFFGTENSYRSADQALARSLDVAAIPANLDTYASSLRDACALPAAFDELPPARSRIVGNIFFLRPGRGAIHLPETATAAVLDLRSLGNPEGLDRALANAIEIFLDRPLPRPDRSVRSHRGLTDEGFRPGNNYYQNMVETFPGPSYAARAPRAIPLAVWIDGKLSPAAAELAAALRLQGRAWLVGSALETAVAETRWRSVGERGIAYRFADFSFDGIRLPDRIPADFQDLGSLALARKTRPPALRLGEGVRSRIAPVKPFKDLQEPGNAPGDYRAALLIAHGAARLFYPYFGRHGLARWDQRLSELYAGAIPQDRASFRHGLRRLGAALGDGHHFVFDRSYRVFPEGGGLAPIAYEEIDGLPVVAASLVDGVRPGDRLIAVEGEPVRYWLRRELARSGGATAGYRFDLAMRELQVLANTQTLTFASANEAAREVRMRPESLETYAKLRRFDFARPSGWIDKDRTYYLNTGGPALRDYASFERLWREAKHARTLILDLRESPAVNAVQIAAQILRGRFSGPLIRTPAWEGPALRTEFTEPPGVYEGDGSFSGKVLLLVGPATVSAAEHFATILRDSGQVKVVGRASAGTNGSLTGLQLPGKFFFTFTGMEVRHANGDPFHGRGIVPDFLVRLSADDFANGRDTVLEEALRISRDY